MDTGEVSVLEVIEDDNWLWEPGEIKVVPHGRPATIDDLRRTKHKAEIVNGEMLVIGPSGGLTANAAGNILISLHQYKRQHGGGRVFGSRLAYILDLPNRQAICPDVSWYTGPDSDGGYLRVAPVFAVEVRDEIDHGDEAEQRMAAKRADYFAAGTQVVWDVDVLRETLIRACHSNHPGHATVYRRGDIAHAEPAVPGWRFRVDELFDRWPAAAHPASRAPARRVCDATPVPPAPRCRASHDPPCFRGARAAGGGAALLAQQRGAAGA
ncbi:Uma2 family endonuclease [Longimicrobium sp.]|uniref:Uma2 family endonuclease n=1 Tax=Longimicrobium sp. TaxID=2029185 RepID=UPI003B3BE853